MYDGKYVIALCVWACTVIAGHNRSADVEPAVHAGGPELCNVLHRAIAAYHLRDALHATLQAVPGLISLCSGVCAASDSEIIT